MYEVRYEPVIFPTMVTIKEAAKAILGGGGGQPGIATAGGKNSGGLPEALDIMLKLAVGE